MAEDAISSEVVLKVANTSGAANENVTFAFNLALLDALPQHEFSTTTIWTEDLNTFSGVLLKDLIELTGFQGESVTAWAINDYMAEFTVGSLAFNTALIATRQNGDTMPLGTRDHYGLSFRIQMAHSFKPKQFLHKAFGS